MTPGADRVPGARRRALLAASVVGLLLVGGCPAPVAPAHRPPAGTTMVPEPPPAPPAARQAVPDPAVQPGFPIRAAFYYAWFPEAWDQRALSTYTRFHPMLGRYDSADRETIAAHVRAMAHARIRAAIVSWWGPGAKHEQARLPALLTTASEVDPVLRLALYYEDEGTADPQVDDLVRDLEYVRVRYAGVGNYLRVDGRPVLFVYNAGDRDCSVADRWAAATAVVDFYVVLKVFPRWDGCAEQPDGWHEYAPAVAYRSYLPDAPAVAGAVTVSPGFWRADAGEPALARDLRRWRRDVVAMAASDADWHLVTSFNEWGEGTAVEAAAEWASPSGFGSYLDVLHRDGA